jgi:hypothetical protein
VDRTAFRKDAVSALHFGIGVIADGRYDQGQLASAALDFALICDPSHADVESRAQLEADQKLCFDLAADIIDYSLRDLLSPEGAFYSAEDADSALKEGEKKSEGAFYIWSKEEFDDVVGEDREVVGWFFGVKVDGNVDPKHDMHGEMTGMVSTQGSRADDRISSVWLGHTNLLVRSTRLGLRKLSEKWPMLVRN